MTWGLNQSLQEETSKGDFKARLRPETSRRDFNQRLQCDGHYVIEHITLTHNMKSSVRDFMTK